MCSSNQLTTGKKYRPRVTTDRRECIMCEGKLIGRSDKVFCGQYCKNKYHAENRVVTKTVTGETIKIIRKNYLILCGLLAENNTAEIRELAINRSGFMPNFATGFKKTGGEIICELFDIRFKIRGSNVVFWRTRIESPYSPFLFERWRRHLGGPTVHQNS